MSTHDSLDLSAPSVSLGAAPTDPADRTRRAFLGDLGRFAFVSTAAAGATFLPALAGTPGAVAEAGNSKADATKPKKRRAAAVQLRRKIAKKNLKEDIGTLENNGDEHSEPNFAGNHTKGLPHFANGEVDPAAYEFLLKALSSGKPALFEQIPLGNDQPSLRRRLCNPQAGLSFDLEGLDVCQFGILPAPALRSAQAAGEMVELYWMARLRDVRFDDYATSPLAQTAAAELSALSDFRGPKSGGAVTPDTLFREELPGSMTGPFLSQFLLLPVPFGAVNIEQRMRTVVPGDEFMSSFPEWLQIQNGWKPVTAQTFDATRRHIRTGRDLAQWVHVDVLYQAYFHAALLLLTQPDAGDLVTGGGLGAPTNPGNPYLNSATQDPFGTFGPPHVMTILTEVATRALKAVWFQKWYVHRRLRPEMYGARVHQQKNGAFDYGLHADVLDSTALADTFTDKGSYLLPQVFPEGSPMHPSYGAGHATVAGACVTILKAMFDESFVISSPKVATSDGLALVDYVGDPLTVGGELNKLAMNVANGRNIAGVHWRSDTHQSLRLGEKVAMSVLQDQRETYNEDFGGLTFTTFDGETVTV